MERKVDQLEEELIYLSAKDLKRIEVFIQEISGKVLHPHHCIVYNARCQEELQIYQPQGAHQQAGHLQCQQEGRGQGEVQGQVRGDEKLGMGL